MTTVLPRTGREQPASQPRSHRGRKRQAQGSWFAREPAWPLIVVLVGWPAWWLLGLQNVIFIFAAIPMARRLIRIWGRDGRIRVPPGFGIWLMFLVVVVAGAATLSLQAPETIASPLSNRVLSLLFRVIDFSASTIALLFVGNLSEDQLPRRRLAWLLGLVGIYGIAGGLAGVVDPNLSFTSPLSSILPSTLQQGLGAALNVGTSQVMGFLGFAEGRVKAPFTYTNQWGDCVAILLPWLFVAWRSYGTRLQRKMIYPLFAVALIPVVVSLDRGLWIGLLIAAVYLAVRLAGQGKLIMLGLLCGAIAVAALALTASPLGSLISQRLQHGKSNTIRTDLTVIAIKDALASPIIGYGDTRHMQGSTQSIAVGATANCKRCGNSSVGGNGQLPLLLVSTGFLGTALYIAYFGFSLWRFRRDRTPYGMAGVLVLLLGFIFMPFYEAAGPPLAFTMLAIALLWRNDEVLRASAAAAGRRPRAIALPGRDDAGPGARAPAATAERADRPQRPRAIPG